MTAIPSRIELQDEWLAALESGAYKQTKYKLHNNLGFCCLGVACDIAKKYGIIKNDRIDEDEGCYLYSGMSDQLPGSVINAFGFLGRSGNAGLGAPTLTYLNDVQGLSFKEIAAHVRHERKNYFNE